MKKLLLTLLVCFVSALSASAYDYVKVNQSVFYNPETAQWTFEKQSDDDIELINHSFVGSGGYQEFLSKKGEVLIDPNFNISYIENGKFIAIDSQNLKFYNYSFEDGKFVGKELSADCLAKLYPQYEVVKISDFKDNKIVLYKKLFTKKNFLIVNDTDKSFYKYSYRPKYVNPSYIKPFLHVPHRGKIEFSHYGDNDKNAPALKIYVRNKV